MWSEDLAQSEDAPSNPEEEGNTAETAMEEFLKNGWIRRSSLQFDVNIEATVKALSMIESSYPRCSSQIDALAEISEYATGALVQKLENTKEGRLGSENAVELFSRDIVEECLREISHLFVLYREPNGKRLKLTHCSLLTQFPSQHQRMEYAKILCCSHDSVLGNFRRTDLESQPTEREINLNFNASAFRLNGGSESRGTVTDRASFSHNHNRLLRDTHEKDATEGSIVAGEKEGPEEDDYEDEEDYKSFLEPMQKLDDCAELMQTKRQMTQVLTLQASGTQGQTARGEAVLQELERLRLMEEEFCGFKYYKYPFGKEYVLLRGLCEIC